MQNLTGLAMDEPPAVRRDKVVTLVPLCDGRQGQHIPGFCLLQVSHKIVCMQPLHDDNDRALILPVEAAAQRIVIPVMDGLPPHLRERIVGLHGIIDDDHIRAAPGHHAADRGREPVTAFGGLELGDGVALCRQPCGEQRLVKGARDQRPAVTGELVRQILRVADGQDLFGGVMAEKPGRKRNGGGVGLEMTRRDIDDEPLALCRAGPPPALRPSTSSANSARIRLAG